MASPRTAVNRYDLSLSYSEFNAAANARKFIGHKVMPILTVGKQNSKFQRLKIADVLPPIEDTKRAPGADYSRGDFEWEEDSYDCDDHGAEEIVDDETVDRFSDIFSAEIAKRNRAVYRVQQSYENDVAGLLFSTSTFSGNMTNAVGTAWSTKATATPRDDIDDAMEKIESRVGQSPNTLVMTKKAWRAMRKTDEIESLLKYSGADDPKGLGALAVLRELFELENIFIANGFKNTADKGQDAVVQRLWDDTMALVCHVHDGEDLEDLEPRIGATVKWEPGSEDELSGAEGELPGVIIEEYREERRRGGSVRARNHRKLKTLQVEAGQLLTGVL